MSQPIDMTRCYTVKKCAEIADVCEGTIRRWMDEGLFTWIKKNRRERLADKKSFDNFIASLRTPVIQSNP